MTLERNRQNTQTQDDPWRRVARYHCEVCSRPFDRKDTLGRHMQLHDKHRPPAKPRRKACISCARSKIRCFGEYPSCSSCQKRSITCIYDKDSQQHRMNTRQHVELSQSQHSQLHERIQPQAQDYIEQNNNGLLSPNSGGEFSQTTFTNDSLESPNNLQNQQGEVLNQLLNPTGSDFFSEIGVFSPFDDTDFNSNLAWIFEDDLGGQLTNPPDLSSSLNAYDLHDSQLLPIFAPPTALSSTRQSINGDNQGENEENLEELPVPNPQDGCSPDDPWPMEWHSGPTQRHLVLPSLGDESQNDNQCSRFFNVPRISSSTCVALQRCIQLPFNSNPWRSINLDRFPSKEKLDHCIDLYFAHFHPMLPVIHQPTFDPMKDLVVTLAVASVGACYTEFTGARSFSNALSELNRRLLVFMAEHDRRFVRTESYLTAQLLQGTHGFCSGSERLFELSESCRSTLVHHAKCMGLFRYEAPQPIGDLSSQGASWHEWIRQERLRRLGWAVYEYDASVAYLHNNRPYLSVGDINLNLPCSSEHWEADSAQSWTALHPWTGNYPKSTRLRPLIRTLFDGSERPTEKITDERQRFLIILTLLRMLWTLKEIKSSPISDLIEDGLDNGRALLLRAIDSFTQSPIVLSKSHTRTEMLRIVHRMQLIHISHLYGAGDLMNWLYPYLRKGIEIENARVRMLQWAGESPARVREVAYHSAQILALVRQYPSNMPFEPFVIFHAGVVLSFMARLLPTVSGNNRGPQLRLDHLATSRDTMSSTLNKWMQRGGNEVVGLHGVPDISCKAGRQQILDQTAELLKRRQVWGVAQNFTRVILGFREEEVG